MANISMICHPDTPPLAVKSINVLYEPQADGAIWLSYKVICDPALVKLPDPFEDPIRTDGLWQTTCFELFLRNPSEQGYFEFNLSPLGHWAAYRFDDYRHGMRDLPIGPPEEARFSLDNRHISLELLLPVRGLTMPTMDVAISAVIHEEGDTKSYWALRHPPGPPDFHHRDCFALKLSPPDAP